MSDRRRQLYKAKRRKGKKRLGRLERLKAKMQAQNDQLKHLVHKTAELKEATSKVESANKLLKRFVKIGMVGGILFQLVSFGLVTEWN